MIVERMRLIAAVGVAMAGLVGASIAGVAIVASRSGNGFDGSVGTIGPSGVVSRPAPIALPGEPESRTRLIQSIVDAAPSSLLDAVDALAGPAVLPAQEPFPAAAPTEPRSLAAQRSHGRDKARKADVRAGKKNGKGSPWQADDVRTFRAAGGSPSGDSGKGHRDRAAEAAKSSHAPQGHGYGHVKARGKGHHKGHGRGHGKD